jgi:hypothetical protein
MTSYVNLMIRNTKLMGRVLIAANAAMAIFNLTKAKTAMGLILAERTVRPKTAKDGPARSNVTQAVILTTQVA